MKISVLICTRNRAKSLDATLQRFFAQRFAGGYEFELIVVDNASTDETSKVIESYAAQHPQTVRRLFESQPGLSFARNAAVRAARGEVVAFTDDDVLVAENWLDEIHCEFAADPNLSILGGRVLLADEKLQRVTLVLCEERGYFGLPEGVNFAIGANMAFRRELFDRLGLFDVRLGPGKFFAGSDDVEFVYRGLKSGRRLLYAPNVLVYHNHDRVTLEQVCQLEYGYAKSCPAYLIKHSLSGDDYAMRMLYWTLCELPRRGRRQREKSEEAFIRHRCYVKGLLVGLCVAPFVMWGNGNA
jgi:glycosyltransferase involved in cell wall biosynthesis